MTDWSAPASDQGPIDQGRIEQRRQQYATEPIDIAELDADPVVQFWDWFAAADDAGVIEPHAMVLSTVDDGGHPDSRVVLARSVGHDGVVFYTNYGASKSQQLLRNPAAALVFSWLRVHRQVRVRGLVQRVSDAESDAYFSSRPRASQIGAWASDQSKPLVSRAALEASVQQIEQRFADTEVPRPAHWGGWRLVPSTWEFWQGRPDRLHDRFSYRCSSSGTTTIERLYP